MFATQNRWRTGGSLVIAMVLSFLFVGFPLSIARGQVPYTCPDALQKIGFDDGTLNSVWKITNPSGPSDWFSVDFDNALAGRTLVGLGAKVLSTDTGRCPSFARIGLYPDALTIDPSGNTPHLGLPIAEISGGSLIDSDGCEYLCFTMPPLDVLPTDPNLHLAFQSTPGDSALWLCADSSSPISGRSYFSSTNYASPATSFSVNWMLRACAVPASVTGTNQLTVNGSTSVTVAQNEDVTFSYYGTAPGNPSAMFTAPPLPIGKASPILPTGFNGPVPHAWTICGDLDSSAPVGFPLTFNVFALDTSAPSPFPILKSNTASMTVTPDQSAPDLASSTDLPPDFLTQIAGSSLTASYEAAAANRGWVLNYAEAQELFYTGMTPNALDARFAMVPFFDGGGNIVANYCYTYRPSDGIEGADMVEMFTNGLVTTYRFYVDPSLLSYVDLIGTDDCIVDAVAVCPFLDSCSYSDCMEDNLKALLRRSGLGTGAFGTACIAVCATGIVPACAFCVGFAAGVVFGIWWDC